MFFRSKSQKAAPQDRSASPEPSAAIPDSTARPDPATTTPAVAPKNAAPGFIPPLSSSPSTSSSTVPAAAMPPREAGAPTSRQDPSAAFAKIVSVLMRAPQTRGLTLADLEWLLVPSLMTQQVVVAEAKTKETGAVVPVGLLFWATVSPEVDGRLRDRPSVVQRLAPNEWTCGEIPWIVCAVGRPEVTKTMLDQLLKGPLAGRRIKACIAAADGSLAVQEIGI